MRITVDIDEKDLSRIQKITGIHKRSPAVRHALRAYLRETERKRFLQHILAGKSDYSLTNAELEAMGIYDPH